MTASIDDSVPSTLRRTSALLKQVTAAFAVTVAVLIVVVLWALLREPTTPTFSPLGDFPVQTVTTAEPIPVGHDVGIDSTRCNNAGSTVQVVGEARWVSVDPLGSSFPGNHGQGELRPGCAHPHFENPMPPEVQARVRALAAVGHRVTTWVIRGTATPIAPRGERPVVKAWTTERFQIVAP